MEPIIDKNTKILILGTFPGEESIKKNEYYASRRNNFWELLGIEKDLDYESKKDKLKQRGIGIWDMFKSVEREGSADVEITSGELNDFNEIIKDYKNIKSVVFNGKGIVKKCKKITEKEQVAKVLEIFNGMDVKYLYSSSGANNRYTVERKKEWCEYLNELK